MTRRVGARWPRGPNVPRVRVSVPRQGETAAVSNENELKLKQNNSPASRDKSQEALIRLDAIFRAIPDLLLQMDSDGRIIDYRAGNPSSLFLPPAEFLGKRIQEILPAEIGDKYSAAIRQAILAGKSNPISYQLNLPDGEHWFEARLVAFDGNQISAILHDMTERVQTNERLQRQARQLSTVQSIDATITASFDLSVTLSVILRQVVNHLGVDAADVLLLNQNTHMLEFAAGQGFQTSASTRTSLMIGQGFAGQAALKRHTVSVPDLNDQHTDPHLTPNFVQEGFSAYYAVPLIAKGQVTGVLEIYRRSPLKLGEEWLEFLNTLAGQAAIAIDSASLFQDLQRANTELTLAYDAAIEGWSQVLEISGRESTEHIHRVVKLTLELAHSMGFSDKELVHIRRGALLHDIGEMGIPEEVLHKAGPLTDEEWKLIQQHPTLAYQLLSPLNNLAPALDIPHYHHEKWDGSGYPDGLKGDQIPLAARIFSVADVYDALVSTRPYRPARSHQESLKIIQEQIGGHFDPKVVAVFLQKFNKPD
jgi:HD-GYP domain-containing protein (c-di-GMP phosphodiesterase class II)